MKIILRKQYVNYEPDQYEYFGLVSKEKIKLDIEKYPWEDQIILQEQLIGFHVKPSFNLEYKKKELTIIGYRDNNFSVCYNHTTVLRWQFQAHMFSMEEVFNLIDQFPILKPKQFKKILATKRTIEESLLSTLVLTLTYKKKQNYSPKLSREGNKFEMTFKRLFYYFSVSLIWLLIPLGLNLIFGSKFDINTPFLIFQGICLLLALPSIIISLNHLTYNGNLKLIFKKGKNKFEVTNDSKSIIFDKTDVLKIIEIQSNGSRAPWALYGYYIIKFKNGSELWVSNILLGSNNLFKQFYKTEKEFKNASLPLLKKTMVLKNEI